MATPSSIQVAILDLQRVAKNLTQLGTSTSQPMYYFYFPVTFVFPGMNNCVFVVVTEFSLYLSM